MPINLSLKSKGFQPFKEVYQIIHAGQISGKSIEICSYEIQFQMDTQSQVLLVTNREPETKKNMLDSLGQVWLSGSALAA